MSEFRPITDLEDLWVQNHGDISLGYQAGLAGLPEPGNLFSRAYWHGWRNGRVNAGFQPEDAAQAMLSPAHLI